MASKRILNNKLHELFPFIPPPSVETSEEEFDRYNRGIQMYTEEEADSLEALKVAVWRSGGPWAWNGPANKEHNLKQPVDLCDAEQHDMYYLGVDCHSCGLHVCEDHSEILMGAPFCNSCAMKFREV